MALLGARVFAQSGSAQDSGFVKDPTGAAVPNAAILLRAEAGGPDRRAAGGQAH